MPDTLGPTQIFRGMGHCHLDTTCHSAETLTVNMNGQPPQLLPNPPAQLTPALRLHPDLLCKAPSNLGCALKFSQALQKHMLGTCRAERSRYLRDVIEESLSKVGKNIVHRIPTAKLDHSACGFDDGHSDLPVLVGDGLHQGAYQGLRLQMEVLCGTGRQLVMRYSCLGSGSVATIQPAIFLWTLGNQPLLASTPTFPLW